MERFDFVDIIVAALYVLTLYGVVFFVGYVTGKTNIFGEKDD